jgi:hypothetical protein
MMILQLVVTVKKTTPALSIYCMLTRTYILTKILYSVSNVLHLSELQGYWYLLL